MDSAAEAKKKIEQLLDHIVPPVLEEEKSIAHQDTGDRSREKVFALLDKYPQILSRRWHDNADDFKARVIAKEITECLHPHDINFFLSLAEMHLEQKRAERPAFLPMPPLKTSRRFPSEEATLGYILNRLILTSATAGYTDFSLSVNAGKRPPEGIGQYLWGRKDHRLTIKVAGTPGNCYGFGSAYINYIFEENSGDYCASKAENCMVMVKKDTGAYFAEEASESTFILHRKAQLPKHSKKCTFLLYGSLEGALYPYQCDNIFKTNQPDILNELQEQVEDAKEIIFIEKDGTERIVKRDEE